MFINLTGVNILQHVCVKSSQYTSSLCNVVGQLYLNKPVGGREEQNMQVFISALVTALKKITYVYGHVNEAKVFTDETA